MVLRSIFWLVMRGTGSGSVRFGELALCNVHFPKYLKGFTNQREIREIPTSEFDKMMDINLKASFLLVKGVVDGMKSKKWGRIIFISSIAAYGAGINGCRKTVPIQHWVVAAH
jgi:NAD(P)-dependent dehydrogenase (short-subunit alcohol dehydrogenase family)